jgi:hypothetical protein
MCLYAIKVPPTLEQAVAIELIKVTKVAIKDITVYKRFEIVYKFNKAGKSSKSHLETPFQGTRLPSNGVLETEDFTADLNSRDLIDKEYTLRIHQGIHAYTKAYEAKSHKNLGETIKTMIIPKGTKYIVGVDNEIVALKMVLKKRGIKANGSKGRNTKPSKRRVAQK